MYRELSRLGALLRIPVTQAHLELEVRMPDGTIVEKRRMRSRTFVRNFWNMIAMHATDAPAQGSASYVEGNLSVKDVVGSVGSSYTSNISNNTFWPVPIFGSSSATLGVATFGIIVGTGLVPENFNSSALANAIASGNGAGQLAYSAQNAPTQAYDFTTKTLSVTHVRVFNNNSGGAITVTETGIYAKFNTQATGFMLLRDLLASPVSVINAAQLTVTYIISMVFPADLVEQPVFPGTSLRNQRTMQQQVSRNWHEDQLRNYVSTQQWQQYDMRRKNIP